MSQHRTFAPEPRTACATEREPFGALAIAAVVAAGMTAAGCSSRVDISGLYEVTAHTLNEASCDTEGAPVDEPPYFSIEKDEFFGQTFYVYNDCTSPSPDDCTGFGLFGRSFTQPISDGWKGQVSTSSGSGGQCYLSFRQMSAVFQPDGSLRIEDRMWQEQAELSEDRCDTDEAEARGSSMPCAHFEVISGVLFGG
jgi:hypothetical protein